LISGNTARRRFVVAGVTKAGTEHAPGGWALGVLKGIPATAHLPGFPRAPAPCARTPQCARRPHTRCARTTQRARETSQRRTVPVGPTRRSTCRRSQAARGAELPPSRRCHPPPTPTPGSATPKKARPLRDDTWITAPLGIGPTSHSLTSGARSAACGPPSSVRSPAGAPSRSRGRLVGGTAGQRSPRSAAARPFQLHRERDRWLAGGVLPRGVDHGPDGNGRTRPPGRRSR